MLGRAVALLMAVALLSSCESGGADEPTVGPSGPGESSATATVEPEAEPPPRDLYRGTAFELPPDADPQLLTTISEKRLFGVHTDFLDFGGVVFGDDVALLLPETQLLTAVSIDTGEVLWQTRLPRYQGELQPLCPLAQLPPGATTAVVMIGLDCGLFLRYDLRTGKLLGKEPQLDVFRQLHINAWFSLDRSTYWVDDDNNVRRFDADGRSELVLTGDQLALSPSEDVLEAMPIVGSEVVALSITDAAGPIRKKNDGRWLGIRVPAEGALEVVWSTPRKAGLVAAKPRGRYSPGDTAVFNPAYGGIVYSVVLDGIRTPRLNRLNPETGALDTGLILRRRPPGGLPAWADSIGDSYLLPQTDAMISGSGKGGFAGYANLTRYDFTTGEIAWTFDRQYPSLSPQQADPVGTSPDAGLVYAMIWADRARLVELDAATGELLRTWQFPRDVGQELLGAQVYVHDDLMVWLDRFHNSDDKQFAATFRLA